jgi:histidinol-phosphatase (PHP family)
MKNNYHTHTVRCHHAQGTEREYIEAAIAAGIKTLGFADHAPQIFPGDYYSHFRMRPEELSDYCSTLRALKEEYKDRIDIKIG